MSSAKISLRLSKYACGSFSLFHVCLMRHVGLVSTLFSSSVHTSCTCGITRSSPPLFSLQNLIISKDLLITISSEQWVLPPIAGILSGSVEFVVFLTCRLRKLLPKRGAFGVVNSFPECHPQHASASSFLPKPGFASSPLHLRPPYFHQHHHHQLPNPMQTCSSLPKDQPPSQKASKFS